MPIEQVETPKTNEEEQQMDKPLLNIQLPAPENGDPHAPLSVGKHNSVAQHNFEQVGNIFSTIISNQKLMGMAITSISDKQKKLEKSVLSVAESINVLLKENEDKDAKPTTTTTTK